MKLQGLRGKGPNRARRNARPKARLEKSSCGRGLRAGELPAGRIREHNLDLPFSGAGTHATNPGHQSGTDDEATRHLFTRMEELLRLQPDAFGAAKARGMDATQVAIRDLEAMEAQQGAVCEPAPAEHPTCPRSSNRRLSAWSLASSQQPGLAVRPSDCLLRFARSSPLVGRALA